MATEPSRSSVAEASKWPKKQEIGPVTVTHQPGGPVTLTLQHDHAELDEQLVCKLFAALVLAKRESFLPY